MIAKDAARVKKLPRHARLQQMLAQNLALTLVVMLALVLASILAGCSAGGGTTPVNPTGSETPAFMLQAQADGSFDEVVANVKGALSRNNFPTLNVRDYGKSFEKRFSQTGEGALSFHRYVIVEACNLELARHTLKTDPRMGVFFPCRVVIYQLEPKGPVWVLTVNPRFMVVIMKNPDLKVMAKQLEDAMKEVFDSINF